MNDQSIILLVEDNPDDVELIEYAFGKAGITMPLAVVTDGQSAWARGELHAVGLDGYFDLT